jgi:CRP/FNR family cyclic AMP-dependent transcriptional regulator
MRTIGKGAMRDLIAGISLFSACSKRELSLLAGIAEQVDAPAGTVLCSEGQSDLGLHVVVDGTVRVTVAGVERRQLGPGAFFGEISLFDGGPRSATVEATTDVTVLHIPAWGFNAVLKQEPELAIKMLKELATRIRENDARSSA